MDITFLTSQGQYTLETNDEKLTLKEFCVQNSLPFQSMSFYIKDGSEMKNIVGLYDRICDFAQKDQEIIVRSDRNINYEALLQKNIKRKRSANASAEYTFSSSNNTSELVHIELTPDDCLSIVSKEVKKFLTEEVNIGSNEKIIMGISGGGDSNTLIRAYLESGLIKPDQIIGVMIMGIPDWDKGRSRAESLCAHYGIQFIAIEEDQMARILNRKTDNDWVSAFEKHYPDSDLEVLGTLGIRLALKHVAKSFETDKIVIGLNLEDLLAEGLLQVMRGALPLPFPEREIDGIKIHYPLYRCPKKILDGCYPKYSLQNYNDRYPSKMTGRAIPYLIAQSIHSLLPGVEFDMIEGLKKLSKRNTDFSFYDKDLGFSTLGEITLQARTKWKRFLGEGA